MKKELQDTATQLLAALKDNDVGMKVSLIFVVHSLGGLIVKAALRQDQESSKIGNLDYRHGTRAVVFIATPHSGSSLANFAAVFPEIVGGAVGLVTTLLGGVPLIGLPIKAALQRSKLVGQLERDDAPLRELANWYRAWAQMNSVMTRAYFETERFKGVLVVVPSSADPGVSGCAPVAVDGANHVTIATPAEAALKSHPVYLGVQSVVSEGATVKRCVNEFRRRSSPADGLCHSSRVLTCRQKGSVITTDRSVPRLVHGLSAFTPLGRHVFRFGSRWWD